MRIWIVVALALVCAGAAGQQAKYRHDGRYALPDARVTPGAVDPLAVADLSRSRHVVGGIERNICAPDFRTRPIRATIHNFAGLKRRACAEYGVARCDKSVEGDHLVSLELGGCPDCLRNVFPQPMAQARVKDRYVEDVLPKLVCAGRLSLKAAQRCIATDWARCMEKIEAVR